MCVCVGGGGGGGEGYFHVLSGILVACFIPRVCVCVGEGGHFLYGAVQGCAAGIGILFMSEIIR